MKDLVEERFATRSGFFQLIINRIGGRETEYAGYVHPDGSRLELQPPIIAYGLWALWRAGSFSWPNESKGFERSEMIIVCDADLESVADWLVHLFHHNRVPFPSRRVNIGGQLYSRAAWALSQRSES